MPRLKLEYPTPAELEVLQVLWQQGPRTVRSVMEALGVHAKGPRLHVGNEPAEPDVRKRARETSPRRGELSSTRPRVSRAKTLGQMVGDLCQRAFSNSASSLVAHMLDQTEPSRRRTVRDSRRHRCLSAAGAFTMIDRWVFWWEPPLGDLWATTLLHFLWQGIVVAAAHGLCLFWLQRSSAQWRYVCGVAWLFVLASCPIVTCGLLAATSADRARFTRPRGHCLADRSPPRRSSRSFRTGRTCCARGRVAAHLVDPSIPAAVDRLAAMVRGWMVPGGRDVVPSLGGGRLAGVAAAT